MCADGEGRTNYQTFVKHDYYRASVLWRTRLTSHSRRTTVRPMLLSEQKEAKGSLWWVDHTPGLDPQQPPMLGLSKFIMEIPLCR